MRLAAHLARMRVAPGTIACAWLGQAGYLFKTAAGKLIMIDPYLSDIAEQHLGLRRQFPAPVAADELQPDLLLVTHWHDDHLDPPTVAAFARAGRTQLVAPASCVARAADAGWPTERLASIGRGETLERSGLRIAATFARHLVPGGEAPDAVGFLLSTDGLKLWHSGDTEYDEHLRRLTQERIDVAFICINGGGGNMNAHEAALLAWQVRPRVAVPMHYGMWPREDYFYRGQAPDATPDPALFERTLRKLGRRVKPLRLEVGRPEIFGR